MGKGIQRNSRKWSSSLAKLLQSKSHKICQSSPQSGSMTLGLSPLQISRPVCSTHAMEVSISFQVSNFHQPILTFIHHFFRTTMGVFMPTCVCRWRGDEHILKMLSSSAGGWKLPGSALGAPQQQQMMLTQLEAQKFCMDRLQFSWNCLSRENCCSFLK